MSATGLLEIQRRGEVFCARLRRHRLDEGELAEVVEALEALVTQGGCRRLALSLGPEPPEFLYSVFLARLIHLQRVLRDHGGALVLCQVGPEVHSIFTSCRLDTMFTFVADFDAAVAHWADRQTP
jgi:hypothetical protein